MSNEFSVGQILEGKVTAIKEYGAFVSLTPGHSGLVHISQIASEYVKSVEDYLSVGDVVQVKVIDITERGKISLSIKQVAPLTRKNDSTMATHPKNDQERGNPRYRSKPGERKNHDTDKMNSLEEKLKKWMKSSEERIHELNAKQKRK